jgi:DNA helicase-2/ATP-dependent DNA helicase PcrA
MVIGYDQHLLEYAEYRKINPAGLLEIAGEIQDAAKQFNTAWDYLNHTEEAIQAARDNKYQQTQTPRVTLTTLHSAKGLEFDTVFIAGAVEGVIPHERSKTEPELEEERRLLYVGVTRARETLYLSVLRTRYDKPAAPSRFLAVFK